jgi:hypothetical protein
LAGTRGPVGDAKEVLLEKRLLTLVVLGVLAAPAARAQAPEYVRQTAVARVARAQEIAADPQLIKAVLAKNATGESLDEVRRKDKQWVDDLQYPLRKTMTTSACAQRLRELTGNDPFIVEVILMDAQGANVCVSRETSDYWQGDEAKFQKSFGADKQAFVDDPAFDASTGTHAIQLTVIVFDGKPKIGALTLTLKVRKGDAPEK